MPIRRRSVARPMRALSPSIVMALIGAIPVAALAQAGTVPPGPPPANAAIAKQGDPAMERLRDAVAVQRRQKPSAAPKLPAPAGEPARRRAFDALRRSSTAPAMTQRARTAAKAGRAALAEERDAMAHRLGQALGLEAPDIAAIAKAAPSPAQHGWVPVLFVSSSMPVATLRTYAGQLERVGGVFAFRGMPGGLRKVAPMAKLSAEILRVDSGCNGPACTMRNVQLIVDPILFRTSGVTRVPALVMVHGDPTIPYCERDDQDGVAVGAVTGRPIVYGDAALSGLLDEQARLGSTEEVRDAQARLGSR